MYLSAEEGRVRHLLLTKPNWHWNVFPMPYYENIGIADKKTVQYPLDLYTNFTFNAHVKGQFHSIILGVLSRHTKWHFKNFLENFRSLSFCTFQSCLLTLRGEKGMAAWCNASPPLLAAIFLPSLPLTCTTPCAGREGVRDVFYTSLGWLPWVNNGQKQDQYHLNAHTEWKAWRVFKKECQPSSSNKPW